ncbi:MAG: hypothetical protein WCH99_20215 [Verrucomicrobiota bacterium]
MIARLTFLGLTLFWLVMNALLWRAEYGTHAGDTPVPVALVWKKILQSPDASALTVYQNGKRTGYCEFSTGVGRQLAALDDSKLPPENLAARAGYQIHLAGNFALGDFTNRIKFDGSIHFSSSNEWRELNLKISSRLVNAEVHSLATNRTARIKIGDEDVTLFDRDVTFAELEKPDALIGAIAGNFAGVLLGAVIPGGAANAAAPKFQWQARLIRVRLGGAHVPVYQLETQMLGQPVVVEASKTGEILRAQLPGGIVARIDGWPRP